MTIQDPVEASQDGTQIVQNENDPEYTNYYRHPDCPVNPAIEWEDMWTAMCDDECPACGAAVSPYKSEIVPGNDVDLSKEPKCGWNDIDLYRVSYEDIEVLIDRQIDGEVEIRVWRNGKYEETPYASMTFEIDTFVCGHCSRDDVASAECNKCEFCTICCVHQEVATHEKGDSKTVTP